MKSCDFILWGRCVPFQASCFWPVPDKLHSNYMKRRLVHIIPRGEFANVAQLFCSDYSMDIDLCTRCIIVVAMNMEPPHECPV